MLVGAIAGAALVEHVRVAAAAGLATGLILAVTLAAYYATRLPAAWREGSSTTSGGAPPDVHVKGSGGECQ